jgi:hypothetical protein
MLMMTTRREQTIFPKCQKLPFKALRLSSGTSIERREMTQTSISSQGQFIEETYHEFPRADRQTGDAAASV